MKALGTETSAEVSGQLERLQNIWELLRRAERLGYSITMSPEHAKALADILENCGLFKEMTHPEDLG